MIIIIPAVVMSVANCFSNPIIHVAVDLYCLFSICIMGCFDIRSNLMKPIEMVFFFLCWNCLLFPCTCVGFVIGQWAVK
jgi:hypothetical protein